MKNPVVGVAKMGSIFARGFLCPGQPVYPVVRGIDMGEVANAVADP